MPILALAVDNDPSTAGTCALCAGLESDFSYKTAASIADAAKRLEGRRFNTIILGLSLPDGDALAFIERLRFSEAHRHLTIAAMSDDPNWEIAALKAGADVFVPKPLDAQILLARIQSVRRRLSRPWLDLRTLSCAGLTFDPPSQSVVLDGRPIKLRPKELRLLEFFLRQPQIRLSREAVWDGVWGGHAKDWRHTVNNGVYTLRRALGDWMNHIEAKKGLGFILTAPVSVVPRSAAAPTGTDL